MQLIRFFDFVMAKSSWLLSCTALVTLATVTAAPALELTSQESALLRDSWAACNPGSPVPSSDEEIFQSLSGSEGGGGECADYFDLLMQVVPFQTALIEQRREANEQRLVLMGEAQPSPVEPPRTLTEHSTDGHGRDDDKRHEPRGHDHDDDHGLE